jgi:hypothetical protein
VPWIEAAHQRAAANYERAAAFHDFAAERFEVRGLKLLTFGNGSAHAATVTVRHSSASSPGCVGNLSLALAPEAADHPLAAIYP